MRRITQADLAREANFTPSYVSMIHSGQRRIRVYETAELIGSITDTDPLLWLKGPIEEIQSVFISRKEKVSV